MASLAPAAGPVRAQATTPSAWPGLAILLLAALALWVGWVGFVFSDDVSYYEGAVSWLADPPQAGVDHWTTRFPVVLTLAAAIAIVGPGLTALAATALFWYAAFVAAAFLLARRIGGSGAAWIAAALIATMPLVATSGSVVNCDLPESFFLLLGILLLIGTHTSPARALLAGASFGTAILCRETALLALAALGPLFLAGHPLPRRTLLLVAAGSFGLLGAEMLFQFALTGDPLHRYTLAFNHDSTISRSDNLEGNLLVHPLLDPLLVLLVNNEFGLLFPLAFVAALAGAGRGLAPERSRAWFLLLAMAVSGFFAVALLGEKLVLNPRYFTLAAIAAAILVALWLARLPPLWRGLGLAALIGSNLALLAAQNAHPQWPAEALLAAVREHPRERILADPALVKRAALPLRWAGIDTIGQVGEGRGLRLVEASAAAPGAAPRARYPSPPTRIGKALLTLGLADALPEPVARRLLKPSPDMLLLPSEPPTR